MGSTSLTYLYDLSGRVVAEDNGTSWGPGYVYVGHQLLALYSGGTSGATYFVHADHLGSSRVLTAMNQSVYDKPDYLPFGEQIAGDTATSHKFTGYPRDADTGLDYASARYYGSRLGRFLTPDPLGMGAAELTNPQSLNQYAYVGDNPTNMTDPGGTDWSVSFDLGGLGGGGGDCIWCELPPSIPQIGGGLPGMGGGIPGISMPGGDGCDFIACGLHADSFYTTSNGSIIGQENGELGPCMWWGIVMGPCTDSYWNSIKGKWQPTKPAPTPDQQKIKDISNALAPLGKLSDCAGNAAVSNFVPFGDKMVDGPKTRLDGTQKGTDAVEKVESVASHSEKLSRVLNQAELPNIAEKVAQYGPEVAEAAGRLAPLGYAVGAGRAAAQTYACYNNGQKW